MADKLFAVFVNGRNRSQVVEVETLGGGIQIRLEAGKGAGFLKLTDAEKVRLAADLICSLPVRELIRIHDDNSENAMDTLESLEILVKRAAGEEA